MVLFKPLSNKPRLAQNVYHLQHATLKVCKFSSKMEISDNIHTGLEKGDTCWQISNSLEKFYIACKSLQNRVK